MHKVLFVDEEQASRDVFERYAHDEFECEVISPFIELEDLIDYIRGASPDAIVLDHRLGEFMPDVTYNGIDVVNVLKDRNPHFPVFVLTAHDGEAMEVAEDVNYVYPKSVVSQKEKQREDGEQIKFNERMRLQIEHYLAALEKAESEFLKLIKKAESEPLNAEEEESLIDLDTFLNEKVGRDLDIPKHLKTRAKADQTLELIEVTKQLMTKISEKQKE